MVWAWIYDRDYGLLNYFLRSVAGWMGLEFSLINWLNDARYVMPALILMNVWRFVGYQALILLAGMQGIDREYYEAARVDGAGDGRCGGRSPFRCSPPDLLPPHHLPHRFVQDLRGGPHPSPRAGTSKSGLTIVYYVFTKAFDSGHYGLASAASVILFAIIFSLSLFQLTVVQKRVHYER